MTTVENIVNFVTNWRTNNGIQAGGVLSETQTIKLTTELQSEISKMSFQSTTPGGKIIPYNGYIGNTPAWEIAQGVSKSNGGKLFYISDLEPGKLLNNDLSGLQDALETAVGEKEITKRLMQGTKDVNGVRSPNGVGDVLSVNDFVSKKAMANAFGDVVTLTGTAADSVWAQTELPELLKKTEVTSINGISRQELLNSKQLLVDNLGYSDAKANQVLNERIALNFELNTKPEIDIHYDSSNKIKAVDMSKVTSVDPITQVPGTDKKILSELDGSLNNDSLMNKYQGLDDVAKATGTDSDLFKKTVNITRHLDNMVNNVPSSEFRKLYSGIKELVSSLGNKNIPVKTLGALGGALLAWEGIDTAIQSHELHENGQPIEGNKLMLGWVAKTSASIAGAEALMIAVAPASLALATCGGPLGVGAAVTLELGAGLVGGLLGYHMIEKIINSISNFFGAAKLTISPLVFDLDGDGVETTSMDAITYFDHDSNGFAEKTGWISADDGFLVYDRNENGIIDNGTELFGDYTPGNTSGGGFEALAQFDTNNDGVINGEGYDLILLNYF